MEWQWAAWCRELAENGGLFKNAFQGEAREAVITPPETNIFAPENVWLEYDPFLLGPGLCSRAMLVLGREGGQLIRNTCMIYDTGYHIMNLIFMKTCLLLDNPDAHMERTCIYLLSNVGLKSMKCFVCWNCGFR